MTEEKSAEAWDKELDALNALVREIDALIIARCADLVEPDSRLGFSIAASFVSSAVTANHLARMVNAGAEKDGILRVAIKRIRTKLQERVL